MRSIASSLAASLALLLGLASARPAPSQDADARSPLAGPSNHGRNAHEPYVTAGDRAYLIGTQDGNFPDQGGHVPGEMGGLWLHPIKLIDGFSATLTDLDSRRDTALVKSNCLVALLFFAHARS